MDLFFTANGLLQRGKGLTFDDVLLVPCHTTIQSRKDPSLMTRLTKNKNLAIPIVSANMDTVTESEMAFAMAKLGGLGILHRFMTIEDQIEEARKTKRLFYEHDLHTPLAVSVGVNEEGMRRAAALVEVGADILTIDIAHGDSDLMFEMLDYVKKNFPHVDIIAGNVATAQGVRGLIDHGADAVKVGIGPGSMCTTRIITGCGIPQLTAIALAVEEARKHDIPVIADGGIKNSGDMVKALAIGAQTVMLGSLLSGCLETPGAVVAGKKKYRGMASKDAQVSWRGHLPKGMAPEGEHTLVSCKGSVFDVVLELTGGIRSGMSYLNSSSLMELQNNARFLEMSAQGMSESKPHGVK